MLEQKQKAYTWLAYYGESSLDERDDNTFSRIDMAGITALALLGQDGRARYVVQIPTGAQAIFRRREQQIIDAQAGGIDLLTIHIIGWESESNRAYLFAFADGSCLLSDNFQAV